MQDFVMFEHKLRVIYLFNYTQFNKEINSVISKDISDLDYMIKYVYKMYHYSKKKYYSLDDYERIRFIL